MILKKCRLCNSKKLFKFLDLGSHPPSDQFKKKVELNNPTTYYPLQVFSCKSCGFKQLNYVVDPKILYQQNYPYESSLTNQVKKHFAEFALSTIQEYNLNQFIPIEETMINVAGYFGINKDEAERRTYKLFNKLGIWNKRKNTPRELSGGMKRRLMIARALIHDPKQLILEEPTAGVDTELRLTMWDFFKELNSKGVTIILTTHYLEEAERLCKNLAIIHKGNIIQHSSMDEVFQMRKKHTYIIKTSNNIEGDLVSDDLVFKTIDPNTCEITVDNEVSVTKIIEKLKDININVLNIISKRNRLEELFMELTKEEIIL